MGPENRENLNPLVCHNLLVRMAINGENFFPLLSDKPTSQDLGFIKSIHFPHWLVNANVIWFPYVFVVIRCPQTCFNGQTWCVIPSPNMKHRHSVVPNICNFPIFSMVSLGCWIWTFPALLGSRLPGEWYWTEVQLCHAAEDDCGPGPGGGVQRSPAFWWSVIHRQ